MNEPAVSIRAQAKKQKLAAGTAGGGQNKEVVKAVLANPLIVPWPNLPRHLQTSVLQKLPDLVPSSVAEYHTSRGRCHRTEKRKARTRQRAEAIKAAHAGADDDESADAPRRAALTERLVDNDGSTAKAKTPVDKVDVDEHISAGGKRPLEDDTRQPLKRRKRNAHPANDQAPAARPEVPQIMEHLVLGINEVIKGLERQTEALKIRLMMMGDALKDQQKGGSGKNAAGGRKGSKGKQKRELLPTAPLHADEGDDTAIDVEESMTNDVTTNVDQPVAISPERPALASLRGTVQLPPLEWIIIPIQSVSPQSLVSPIPPYCATFNTLLYQYNHLSKIVRARLPAPRAEEVLGSGMEEVRIVPMGDVEQELAAAVGLRRLACMGLRTGHPQIHTLRNMLPKSILHPPRHSLTLPFPTSSLAIHADSPQTNSAIPEDTLKSGKPAVGKKASSTALLPHVHYAPLHVKGITTTIPADGNARKQARLEEVRKKRREAKERKRLKGKKKA